MQELVRERRYTYDDYCKWDDGKRYELINGAVYAMSSPSRRHQWISGNLHSVFHQFLKGKQCEVYHAPFDVRLNAVPDSETDNESTTGSDSAAGDNDTVVQPDLVIVCDHSKLDDRGCKGAPDLVVEILSPSTASMDKVAKLNKYQEAGVREYWIVDPESNSVLVFTLKDGNYIVHAYGETETVSVSILENCTVDLNEIF